jgi:hypothetical protein
MNKCKTCKFYKDKNCICIDFNEFVKIEYADSITINENFGCIFHENISFQELSDILKNQSALLKICDIDSGKANIKELITILGSYL